MSDKMNASAPKLNIMKITGGIVIIFIISNLAFPGLSGAKIFTSSKKDIDCNGFYNIVFEGDSLTAEETYPNYVRNMMNAISDGNAIHNAATPGQTLYPTMIMDAPHQVDTKFLGPNYRNIAVIWAGTNDIFLDSGLDVPALHESIRDWCNGRRERGFQVIVCTITPRSDYGAPGSFEENRHALNEMIRQHYPEYADGLADIAIDPNMGDAGDELDAMFYYDRVHMTALGYAIVANTVKDAIIRLPLPYLSK